MKQQPPTNNVHSAIADGWVPASSFFSSILSGTLLGYLADMWLGTEPWLVVIGAVLGSYSGFMRLWHYSKTIEDHPRGR